MARLIRNNRIKDCDAVFRAFGGSTLASTHNACRNVLKRL
nr:MAG TPA: hypothetical protein [Caudoviricetes sp.]